VSYLITVSFIWAISFGLIKQNLQNLDPNFVALTRMGLAFLALLPFLRPKKIKLSRAIQLMLLGGIQFGLMYVLYTASFAKLHAHEVALFSALTPVYVVAIEDLLDRKISVGFLAAAVLAAGSAAALAGTHSNLADNLPENIVVWNGFFLVQGANICFAIGQVWYRRLASPGPAHSEFALPYAGAVIATALSMVLWKSPLPTALTPAQIATLSYLGLVASGLGFLLWNHGATRTNAGLLAVFNNVKVPLAVVLSFVVFGESADPIRLAISGSLLTIALWIGYRRRAKPDDASRCQLPKHRTSLAGQSHE